MGRNGPNFANNLVRKDGTIWPMGEICSYEEPHYKYDDRLFKKYTDIRDYIKK